MQTEECLQRALNYIEANLTEKITLEDIADVANYSPWHFHRLFQAFTGKGVGEYVRLRRLSEAGRVLVFSSTPIKEIAIRYQFESQAAFTRAYRNCFGVTPGKLRRDVKIITRFEPVSLQGTIIQQGEKKMKTKIVNRDSFKVIGLDCYCSQIENTIPQLWDRFMKVMHQVPNVKPSQACYGVCLTKDEVHVTPESEFRYIAGLEVTSFDEIPEGMVQYTVPKGEYLVVEHVGALDSLPKTYDWVYKVWFEDNSEYETIGNLDFEVYDERFKFGESDSVMEIWVPVNRK
ncbi:MAG: AraC family transcriptional regulator [Candidatus Cloacimonetes bacterium]|nr:AraC family transcriptional regulator [Candidatus Cloacimonadota bacterium]